MEGIAMQVYRREEMLPVSKIRKLIPGKDGGPCSRQHVYNLIDEGKLKPAFRFGDRQGICVPKPVVDTYLRECEIGVAV